MGYRIDTYQKDRKEWQLGKVISEETPQTVIAEVANNIFNVLQTAVRIVSKPLPGSDEPEKVIIQLGQEG